MLSGRGRLGATLVGVLQPAGDRCRVEQYLVLVTIGNAAGSEVRPYPLDLDAALSPDRRPLLANCHGPGKARSGPRTGDERKEGRAAYARQASTDEPPPLRAAAAYEAPARISRCGVVVRRSHGRTPGERQAGGGVAK